MKKLGSVVVGLVALAVVAAGCGDANDGADGTAVVVDAASKVKAAGEATATEGWLETRTVTDSPLLSVTVESAGSADGSVSQGTSRSDGVELRVINLDGTVYFDVSELESARLEPGKQWISLPRSAIPKASAETVAEQMALLSDISTEVEELGDETVNGVESQGYRMTVRMAEYVNKTGLLDTFEQSFAGASGGMDPSELYDAIGVDDAAGFFEMFFGDELTIEVYVGDGLIRRMVERLTALDDVESDEPAVAEMAEMAKQLESTSTFDVLGAGTPVEVTRPDPSLVQPAESFEEYMGLLTAGARESAD